MEFSICIPVPINGYEIFLGFPRNFPGIPGNFPFPKVGNGIFYLFAFPFPKMGMEFAIHIHIPVPENGNGICHFPFPKCKSHSRSWLWRSSLILTPLLWTVAGWRSIVKYTECLKHFIVDFIMLLVSVSLFIRPRVPTSRTGQTG